MKSQNKYQQCYFAPSTRVMQPNMHTANALRNSQRPQIATHIRMNVENPKNPNENPMPEQGLFEKLSSAALTLGIVTATVTYNPDVTLADRYKEY